MEASNIAADMAIQLLLEHPKGLRRSEILDHLEARLPQLTRTTLISVISRLPGHGGVERVTKGFYVCRAEASGQVDLSTNWPERKFYDSYAAYLAELEGCLRILVTGTRTIGDKYGTPDVLGRRAAEPGALVPYGDTVVAGELKATAYGAFEAFGQACAYRLFAHISYMAVPRDLRARDLRRLEALCLMFQVGLVLFDAASPDEPRWELRVRPQPGTPLLAYTNEKLAQVREELYGGG